MNMPILKQLELPFDRVKKALDKIIKQNGFETFDTKVMAGSDTGDNFMGVVYRIIVTGTLKDGSQSELRLFCKMPPQNETRRAQFNARDSFLKESRVFKEILPQFLKLQEEKHIVEDPFHSFIKCYVTCTVAPEEFIIMEDLQVRDYVMHSKSVSIDLKHAKLVMTELGKLHAFSFALREQKPGILETYATLKEQFTSGGEGGAAVMRGYIATLFDNALGTLDLSETECRQKFEAFKDTLDGFSFYTEGERAEPYAVVCHGDCWNNNMLFKYEDGKPDVVTFIDWQITRYASPVLDLMYYIFCCTDKALRDDHYIDLLNTYYDSLTRFLGRLGSDASYLYPLSAFRQHLMEYGSFGLIMAAMTLGVFVSEGSDIGDLDEYAEKVSKGGKIGEGLINVTEKSELLYKTRMGDVIRDMVRLGYI